MRVCVCVCVRTHTSMYAYLGTYISVCLPVYKCTFLFMDG